MSRIRRAANVVTTAASLRRGGASVGRHPRREGLTPFVSVEHGAITIGDAFMVRGMEARASLRATGGGVLTIGDRALVNSGASIECSVAVTIGDDFLMAAFASVADTDGHEIVPGGGVRRKRVLIGDRVWIGRAAIILPGVVIGDGAVIGAGSIVTRDVPAWTVSAGSPARVIREIDPNGHARH